MLQLNIFVLVQIMHCKSFVIFIVGGSEVNNNIQDMPLPPPPPVDNNVEDIHSLPLPPTPGEKNVKDIQDWPLPPRPHQDGIPYTLYFNPSPGPSQCLQVDGWYIIKGY